MLRKKIYLIFPVLLLLAIIFTVFFYNYSLNITKVIRTETNKYNIDTNALKKPVVYIGVISRYPPNIIFRGYQPILDYLTNNTDYRFELKFSDDYNQAVKMLINKEVSAAFLGSYVYVKAHKDFGVIPILKPLNENFEPFSRSVLFTRSSSDIYNLKDIKNKKLALPSKESFSSNWLLHYIFDKQKIKTSYLKQITNFPHHQTVIQNVQSGNYDVGVTREYLIKKITDGSIRVILYSEPFPTSPIVVSSDYPHNEINALKNALLKINLSNSKRDSVTRGWDNEFINGFVEASDKDYDFVRAISK